MDQRRLVPTVCRRGLVMNKKKTIKKLSLRVTGGVMDRPGPATLHQVVEMNDEKENHEFDDSKFDS